MAKHKKMNAIKKTTSTTTMTKKQQTGIYLIFMANFITATRNNRKKWRVNDVQMLSHLRLIYLLLVCPTLIPFQFILSSSSHPTEWMPMKISSCFVFVSRSFHSSTKKIFLKIETKTKNKWVRERERNPRGKRIKSHAEMYNTHHQYN